MSCCGPCLALALLLMLLAARLKAEPATAEEEASPLPSGFRVVEDRAPLSPSAGPAGSLFSGGRLVWVSGCFPRAFCRASAADGGSAAAFGAAASAAAPAAAATGRVGAAGTEANKG